MQLFVIISVAGIKINVDANVKNWLIMEDVNLSNCECECDKLCNVGEYLDYKNCKCRKRLIDKLVEESSENIDKNGMIYNSTLKDYEKICISCTVYLVLFLIAFLMIIGISSAYFYFHWYLIKDFTHVKFNTNT